jgi:hypothetical protein
MDLADYAGMWYPLEGAYVLTKMLSQSVFYPS